MSKSGRETSSQAAGSATNSERLIDTEAAGIAALRGGSMRTVAYVAGMLLALASAPLLLRHLGQVKFGEYTTVISLIAIVFGMTEAGIGTIAIREFTTHEGDARDRVISNLFGIRLVVSAVGIAGAVGFAAVAGYGEVLVAGTAIAGLAALLNSTQALWSVGLQGELRFGWITLIEFLRQVATVVLIVAAVVLGADILGFLLISVVVGFCGAVVAGILVFRLMRLRPRFDVREWPHLIGEAIPYTVAIALNALYFRYAVVATSLLSTKIQTGYFATSFRIVEVLIALPALVLGAAFPILTRVAGTDERRFGYATGRMFELALIAGAGLSVGVFVTADFAVELIGGSKAAPAGPVLRIQALALLGSFLAVGCGYPLLAQKRHREVLIANLLALLVAIAAAFVLIPEHGARGAAAAAVAAEYALALSSAAFLAAEPSVKTLIRWSSFVPVVFSATLAGAVGVLVPVHPLLGAVLATAVFALGLKLSGRFPPELQELIQSRRSR